MENPMTHSDLWHVINEALAELSVRDSRVCGLSPAATIEAAIEAVFDVKKKSKPMTVLVNGVPTRL